MGVRKSDYILPITDRGLGRIVWLLKLWGTVLYGFSWAPKTRNNEADIFEVCLYLFPVQIYLRLTPKKLVFIFFSLWLILKQNRRRIIDTDGFGDNLCRESYYRAFLNNGNPEVVVFKRRGHSNGHVV